jgi:hypothetical protein
VKAVHAAAEEQAETTSPAEEMRASLNNKASVDTSQTNTSIEKPPNISEANTPAEHLLATTTAEPEISAALEPGCASNFIGGLIKLKAATQTDHPIDFFKSLLAERGDLNLSRIINFLVTVAGLPEKQMRGRIGALEAENSELRTRIARLEAARVEDVSKAVQ